MKRDAELQPSAEPTFVWTVVGIEQGNQGEMLGLSALSAHLFHPSAKKICLVPTAEASATRVRLARLRDLGCHLDIVGVDVPALSRLHQSRWLKIQAYPLLRQNCLFLDTDTLFVRKFDFRVVRSGHVSACENRDGVRGKTISSEAWVRERFVACNWDWPSPSPMAYLNSGVILYDASTHADEFVSLWFKNWNHAMRCTGEHLDQPAFNFTARTLNRCSLLPPSWNAPVFGLPQLARDAHLFHYYSSKQTDWARYTLWGWLIEKMRSGTLDPNKLKRVLLRRRPYVGLGATVGEYRYSKQWGFYAIARLRKFLRAETNRESLRST